ncbi:MAG: DUF2591 domain-containing protein [Altererythrobacter sp.]|nr:DUF2591 domain-containing protein [Altererythrobacter sp.]
MNVKTQDLIGEALDLAVAECVGLNLYVARLQRFSPSTNWAQGGPIIEREYISVCAHLVGRWNAYLPNEKASLEFLRSGPTPLVAAMRCYVASKLGEEIDINMGELL